YMSFSSGKIHLTAIKLEEESPLIESTLEESLEGSSTLLKSVAVVRNNKTFIPKSDTRYQKGDLLFILSKREGDTKIAYLLGREKRKVRKLMIVGGTPIGKMVAERMEKMVDRVVLVEEDRERCDYLNEKLNNSLVINGSAQEEDLLIGERLAESDLFIAVTQSSEKNILSSIMAKKLGVKRAIAEVEHLDYITLATNMGVDAVINKKLITASQIYRFTLLHTTQTVKCLNGSDANLLEYIAAPNTLVTKKKIGELNLPPEVIIGGIIRGSNAVIATAETQINPYDRVLLVALSSSLRVINRFFM
ncbi:MAG: NAD-binding protein, partial [Bacteroidales bacterium]